MPQTEQKPFDLSARRLRGFDDYQDLAHWLCDEINAARDVRSAIEPQLDYWHRIYEQDRTRLSTNRPKTDGADLTSPLGTQYVDSFHARTMQTIFGVEPIWTVEGWAESAEKAPYVEEFHQWTAEDERVQGYVDRAIMNSWIDSVGVLEVYEEIDYRPIRKTIWAKVETVVDEMGQPRSVIGQDGQPSLVMENGKYVEVPMPEEGVTPPEGIAEVEVDSYEPVRVGPGYAIIDYQDFLALPGHARDKRDVWGYAKRFFRRVPYLEEKAKDGIYDADAVENIGADNDRQQTLEDARLGLTIARQEGRTAEKELYEIAFLANLDGKGERWWVATVHVPTFTLLRLKYDDLGTQVGFGRFIRFVPLPRKNSLDGFSLIGHKLITLIEEHTAIRNMRADRSALATAAPIKVQQGALYDPEEHPFGPGSVIYCRDMNEVQPMVIPDVPASVNVWESSVLDAAERTMGVNDIASGVTPSENRTLGERQMQAGYSEVRMSLVVKRLQEAMEELGQIRHAIWKNVLNDQGDMPLPQSAMYGIEARGLDIQQIQGGKMTAAMLDGKYKFKPRGSVDTADNGRLRSDFTQMIQILPALMQTNPMIAAAFQTPEAARALLEQLVKLYRFQNRQAILGQHGQQAGQTAGLIASPEIQNILQQFGAGAPGSGAGMGPGVASPGAPPAAPSTALPMGA